MRCSEHFHQERRLHGAIYGPARDPGKGGGSGRRLGITARVEEGLRQFEAGPPTPAALYALEKERRAAFDVAGRALLTEAFRRREPAARDRAAPKVRFRRETYG